MKNEILRFDPDDENWKLSREDLLGAMFGVIFSGGIPEGDEGYDLDFEEVRKLISQPDMTYVNYLRKIPFRYSMDSLAYQTPWYTYDKRFTVRSYRDFIWEVKKVFGIKIAYIFFTQEFRAIIKPTPRNLKGIEAVFFNTGYLQFT